MKIFIQEIGTGTLPSYGGIYDEFIEHQSTKSSTIFNAQFYLNKTF